MTHELTLGLAILALASSTASIVARAAIIEGEITFPSRNVPALTAYAFELDTSRTRTAPVAEEQTKFSIDVPPGRYVVFLAPNEAGAPNIYGAYTQFSACMAHETPAAGADTETACQDHSLIVVNLKGNAAHAKVAVDDWYLSDEIADQIDHMRGAAGSAGSEPLGAPRFSEYKANPSDATPAPKPDLTDSAERLPERARLQQLLASGPNYAAYLTAALTQCGSGCQHLVLIDWHSGKISEPPEIGEIQGTLPCRGDEVVLFRRDSRLLSVSRTRADRILTQYFLWKPETEALVLTAEFQRTEQQFCALVPP
ncbi:MAG: hypothetical protein ACLQJ0_24080 [Steroidobacteraceae bacterium]